MELKGCRRRVGLKQSHCLFFLIPICLFNFTNIFAENTALLELTDSPGVIKTTSLDDLDCIDAFNKAFGVDAREGLNIVKGNRIYLGVGSAQVKSKSSWPNPDREAQLSAEIRAKESYVINKSSFIESDFTIEMNGSQEITEYVTRLTAYADIPSLQMVYSNYNHVMKDYCVVVTKTSDSALMAEALRQNENKALPLNRELAYQILNKQISNYDNLLNINHGLMVLRDEDGELLLLSYVKEPYKLSADGNDKKIKEVIAMKKAEGRAKDLVNNFINEKIFSESIDTILEITTLLNEVPDNNPAIFDYFGERSSLERLSNKSYGNITHWKKIGFSASDPFSGKPIYIYFGAVYAEDLRSLLSSKKKRNQ